MSIDPVALRIDWIDPEALFRGGPAREQHGFWLDAGPEAADGWSFLGTGDPVDGFPPEQVLATHPRAGGGAEDRGDGDPAETQSAPGGFVGGWVGWAGYDAGAAAAGAPATDDTTVPSDAALRVRRLVAFDHAQRTAWLIAPRHESPAAIAELDAWRAAIPTPLSDDLTSLPAPLPRAAAARHTPGEYAALIERCRDAIRAGDAYQLCLTTRFDVEASGTPIDPVATYLALRSSLPAHHGGYIRVGEHALLSASPEQFLHVAGGLVRTRPIKGTRPRGDDPAADAALARDLAASPKERAENVMIVDLMRNDLQRVCLAGSVTVERLLEVESYPAVHQLVSTIAGRLVPATTAGELMAAAFPAGSMTGAPKLSAMTILHTLEAAPRGVYAGCFGWIGEDGHADLAMTIRSIVVHPGGAYVGAGGGITWLSEADAEVAEVSVKARGPLAALGAGLPEGW